MGQYNVQIIGVHGLTNTIFQGKFNMPCVCWLVAVQVGKLTEGSTGDSDKCSHSVKHPQDFQQTAEVYTTVPAKEHSMLELVTFHIPPFRLPSPTTAADYFKVS